MRSIVSYDVTAACGYVGWFFNGFKNPLALFKSCRLNALKIYLGCAFIYGRNQTKVIALQ